MGLGIRVYVSADDECGFGTGIDHWAALEIAGGRYRVISLEGKEGSVLSDASFSPDRHGFPGIWLKEVCVCVCVSVSAFVCLRVCILRICMHACMHAFNSNPTCSTLPHGMRARTHTNTLTHTQARTHSL